MMDIVELTGWLTAVLIPSIFLIIFILTTPAWSFFVARMRKKIILIHPRQNRYAEIIAADRYGNLAYVKNHGYYLLDPKHVYIEPKSKLPVAVVYGNIGITIDPKAAEVVDVMNSFGISNYEALKELIEKNKKENKPTLVTIWGETVDLEDIERYFASTERSDFIEAEIQRRTAAQVIQKLRTPENWFKWAIILVIILIGAAIAYVMIHQGTAGSIVEGIKSATSGITGQPATPTTVPVNTNVTGVIVK
jgi:hypothetical protein